MVARDEDCGSLCPPCRGACVGLTRVPPTPCRTGLAVSLGFPASHMGEPTLPPMKAASEVLWRPGVGAGGPPMSYLLGKSLPLRAASRASVMRDTLEASRGLRGSVSE